MYMLFWGVPYHKYGIVYRKTLFCMNSVLLPVWGLRLLIKTHHGIAVGSTNPTPRQCT